MVIDKLLSIVGTIMVAAAYWPQITHLIIVHCSAGISRKAFGLWTVSAAIFLFHAIIIHDSGFIVLQSLQLVATALIVIYAYKYRNQVCALHKVL